jgi:hypothetical protein
MHHKVIAKCVNCIAIKVQAIGKIDKFKQLEK